uniref:Early growth response protein 1-like n=1 Tax=Diabrotica virgifera virgifera TaxID=50390 RepID=A0A6P7H4Y4_DIAVI
MKIRETLHSSHKGKYTDQHAEGKILNKNMIVATGQKHYNCEICLKQFSKKNNLEIHLRTHTGEKPHTCEICFKQFSQEGCSQEENKYIS